MKTRLIKSLLTKTAAASLLLTFSLFVSCDTEAPSGVWITTPKNGETLSALTDISGTYTESSHSGALLEVKFTLMRYSDNKFWNGLGWGASTDLPTTDSPGNWQIASSTTLPSGTELQDDYYLITARAKFASETEQTGCMFTVGTPAPPVLPAPWAWGDNTGGKLGSGAIGDSAVPIPVFMRGVLEGKVIGTVAAGGEHTLAIASGGQVYAWGSDSSGQLGSSALPQNISGDYFMPVKVDDTGVMAGRRITAIAAGGAHSLAVSTAGEVFAWGSDMEGQIGDGGTFGLGVSAQLPVAVTGIPVPVGKRIIAVSAGFIFSAALSDEGKLYTWGQNVGGELGTGVTSDRSTVPVAVTGLGSVFISEIDCGDNHSLALSDDGKVYAWGYNGYGRLGDGSTATSATPVLITGAWGSKKIISISAGESHSLAVDEDGTVYAWGENLFGELGIGSTTEQHVPVVVSGLAGQSVVRVQAGWHDSFAWTRDNKVFSWGRNHEGQLARSTAPDSISSTPQETGTASALSGGRYVLGLSAGKNHTELLTGFTPRPLPEIEVEAQGVELTDGGTLNFGTVGQGSSNPIFIKVRNRGSADLTDLGANITGSDYFGTFFASSLAPNGETGFNVFFNPNATGTITGSVQIFSNDSDENPFDITLTGTAYPVGQVDMAFDPQVSGDVQAISLQPDGKAVIGGSFTSVASQPRNRSARLDAATGAPDAFDPDLGSFVYASAVLPDGKVMIAGGFTTVGGVTRTKLARLNANGTLDTGYNAQLTSGDLFGLALQSDGKLIIVGNVTAVAGTPVSYIARLNPNGTLDGSFTPSPNSPPRGVAVRPDGQVFVWGAFTTINGGAYSRIALLNGIDGTTDSSFANPLITLSGSFITTAALQANGKILVGGDVQSVNGVTIHGMCRLDTNGTLDNTFNPDVNGEVRSIALQADGRMIICGQFTTVSGQPRDRIAKVYENGSLDFYFNPGNNGAMKAVTLQADGKVLCTPFTLIGGQSRSNFARLSNDVATQSLSLTNNGTNIQWLRGGASPEANLVTFDISTDGGATWTPVGAASRVSFPVPGWQLFDGGLPPTGKIRARAYSPGAYFNGSVSLHETIVTYGTPADIVVTENSVPLTSGFVREFGVVATGSAASVMQLTIQNSGGSTLTGLNGVTIEDDMSVSGDHTSQFQLGRPATATLAPGASTTMTVTYRPKTTGRHSAFLNIPTNDPDQSLFTIRITGQGSLPITTYKQIHFGQTENSGPAADTALTPNGNTVMGGYGTGIHPVTGTGNGTSIDPPTTGSPFAPSGAGKGGENLGPPGGTFLFHYQRNKLALADLIFQAEWSDTLAESDWHTTGVTEQIDSDDDTIQQITATVPAGTSGSRFVRLKMTRP